MKQWLLRSFRNRILVGILSATILPVLLCYFMIFQLQVRKYDENQRKNAQNQLQQCVDSLSVLFESVSDVAKRLDKSTIVHSVLRQDTRDSRILYQVLSRETQDLRQYMRVDIYLRDGSCGYSSEHVRKEETMDPEWGILYAARQTDELVFSRSTDGESVFHIAKAVRSFDQSVLGYIVFSASWNSMNDLFRKVASESLDVAILDSCWEPAYSTRPASVDEIVQKLRSRILSGEDVGWNESGESRYYTQREPISGFFVLLTQTVTFNNKAVTTFNNFSIILSVLCFMLCLCAATALSASLSRPVNRLELAMNRVEQGDFSARLETGRADEFGRLAENFNRMVGEYQSNLIRSVQNQRELNDAQVRMMQAQLNPHFLYNTLDSMKWLGIAHQVPGIAELATDLATLLRSAINAEEFFTLEQELELVERYMDIQYIRFEDRFTCEIEVDDRFQHCLVPKLILQPLVENAIIHGVADREEGYIKVTAAQDGGDLILSVRDNGCGIPSDALSQINQGMPKAMGKHLGIYNVNQILRLHYGEEYGVRAESVDGHGSCVQLRIPMEQGFVQV